MTVKISKVGLESSPQSVQPFQLRLYLGFHVHRRLHRSSGHRTALVSGVPPDRRQLLLYPLLPVLLFPAVPVPSSQVQGDWRIPSQVLPPAGMGKDRYQITGLRIANRGRVKLTGFTSCEGDQGNTFTNHSMQR